jgi:small subunit ribosomal protein S5
MTETKTTTTSTQTSAASEKKVFPKRSSADRSKKGRGRGRSRRKTENVREFEQKILDLARVTRVTAGGKRMSFRCALVIGDKKGQVGLGVAKGADVQIAVEKSYKQAKKNLVTVPLVDETIPHAVVMKFGSAQVLLKPAPKGTGLKSGGAARVILEFAGVPNAVSKILNSNNKINIASATLKAIKNLRSIESKPAKESKKEVKPENDSKES